ncbi:Transcription factor PIL1 [Euphorbia peplus]|nr:Transcription factor PIL1 [Euphorbia peplus]
MIKNNASVPVWVHGKLDTTCSPPHYSHKEQEQTSFIINSPFLKHTNITNINPLMASDEVAEIVCENGQIFMRGRSTNHMFQSKKAQIQQSFSKQSQNNSVLLEDKSRSMKRLRGGADVSPSEWFTTSLVSHRNFCRHELPDYQSEAPRHTNGSFSGRSVEEVAPSSSEYSLGTSINDDHTWYSLERIDEESETTTSDNEEEEEQEEEEEEQQVRNPKRRRTYSEIHNLSEKKRRDKINKKMQTLQALIPNSDKVDKATMLENAIDYLKSLQLQLQLMTVMGSRVCMMAGMGLGMRMPIGVGFCPTPFPNAPMLGLSTPSMLPIPALFDPLTATPRTTLPIPPNSGPPASILDFISMNNSQFQDSNQVTRQSTKH